MDSLFLIADKAVIACMLDNVWVQRLSDLTRFSPVLYFM